MAQEQITQTGAFTAETKDAINSNFTEIYSAPPSGALTDGHVYVGDSSNLAQDVAMSGDVAITNAGVTSIASGITTHKLPAGVAAGYIVARGTTSLDGSNPTAVATGLTSVVSFNATVRSTDVSSGTAYVTHGTPSGANVNLYAWDKDGAASAGTEVVDWTAIGT